MAFPAGDNKTAIAAAEESLGLATGTGQSVIAARAAAVLGVALFDDGQPRRAAAVLTGPDGDQLAALPSTWRAYFLELMTRYWLALGDRAEAGRAAEGAQSCAVRGRPAPGYRDGASRSGRHRLERRRRARRPLSGPWPQQRSPTRSTRRSRPALLEPSPAAQSRSWATATVPSRCSRRQPPSSEAVAPRVTAMPPNSSYAGWDSTSTAEPARVTAAEPGSARSRNESFRSPC